jgi:aspartyl-tRNA synthetase
MLDDMKTIKTDIIGTLNHIGTKVTVQGWVHSVRDMGKIVFIELRDHTGNLQVVVSDPKKLPKLSLESVVEIGGEVRKRGERYINTKIATGTVELDGETVNLISTSADLPFELKKDTSDVNEELRLRYRYLDLRSERMAENLKLRHKIISNLRASLDGEGFTEIETPMLTKGTPEGAREFLVPSRLHPEEFYVLPQSPQQFKQLLMVGGIGRYYQIARCLRDEDQRGDRQPEFTQLDMELSFVEQEDILALNETLMIKLIKAIKPEAKITSPFPRLTYADAMAKYKSDRPDLRKNPNDPDELAFCWVVDFPMFEINSQSSKIDAVHHPFTAPKTEDIAMLDSDPTAVRADAYDLVLNGHEIGGGSIRIHQADLQHRVFELLGLGKTEIKERFGHMLEAFSFGAPPHGGIAYGLDRLIMILAGEPNIREVIAFPKTGDGRDPLTGAPGKVEQKALTDAHIQTIAPKRS